jgi:hypothetical protein
VKESCAFLNDDTFKPDGNQQQQSKQIAEHYHEIADKVAPEIGTPSKDGRHHGQAAAHRSGHKSHPGPAGEAQGPVQQDRRILQVGRSRRVIG